jgi:hypothetical protein
MNLSVAELTKRRRAIRLKGPVQADRMARSVRPEAVPRGVLVLWEVKQVRELMLEWVLHGASACGAW